MRTFLQRWYLRGVLGKRAVTIPVPVWEPPTLPGLELWFRADQGLWQDAAMTVPVTTNADPVGAWEDLSGNGRHLTQTTSNLRPTYLTDSGFHGRPGVRFSGQWLSNAAFSPIQDATKGTWVLAYRVESQAAGGIVSTTQNQLGIVPGGGTSMLYYINSSAAISGQKALYTLTGGQAEIFVYDGTQTGDANRLRLYRNGVQRTLSPLGTIPNKLFAGGATVYAGRNAAGSAGTVFRLMEAAYYSQALTDEARTEWDAYLIGQYFSRTVNHFICHGDSLTLGYPTANNITPPLTGQDSYPLHTQVILGVNDWSMTRIATGGNTWSNLLASGTNGVDQLQDDHLPQQVLIAWAGTNDLFTGVPIATIKSNIQTYVTARKTAGIKTVFIGTLSQRDDADYTTSIEDINAWIRAGSSGADGYVDFGADPRFDERIDCHDGSIYFSDFVHFTNGGNAALGEIAAARIEALV